MFKLKVSPNTYHSTSFVLSSGDGEDYPECKLTLAFWKYYIELFLPRIITPKGTKVYPESWDAETVKRLGRDFYIKYARKDYGAYLFEGYISIMYGIQTGDSSDDQRWGFFLPWTQHTFVRRTIFNSNGTLFANFKEPPRLSAVNFEAEHESTKEVAKDYFLFKDFDGEEIAAECFIEEREWVKGNKWCSWLKYLTKPIIRRDMAIEYTSEVGARKNSWKGGTLGTGIDIAKGESCISAFKRHCVKTNLTLLKELTKEDYLSYVKVTLKEPLHNGTTGVLEDPVEVKLA